MAWCRSGWCDSCPWVFWCRSTNVMLQVLGWCDAGPWVVWCMSLGGVMQVLGWCDAGPQMLRCRSPEEVSERIRSPGFRSPKISLTNERPVLEYWNLIGCRWWHHWQVTEMIMGGFTDRRKFFGGFVMTIMTQEVCFIDYLKLLSTTRNFLKGSRHDRRLIKSTLDIHICSKTLFHVTKLCFKIFVKETW